MAEKEQLAPKSIVPTTMDMAQEGLKKIYKEQLKL